VRDVIWTIIIIWVVYKIYDAFKTVSKNKNQTQNFNQSKSYTKEGEVKIEHNATTKSHYNPNDAEYVDYEEVK
jgi:hypothetical protein